MPDPFPFVVKRARAARIWDADDNGYRDCMLGFSTMILGNPPDEAKAAIREGLEQLVILGAGHDARAYRFPTLKADIMVFEMDHPATQAVKLRKLGMIFGTRPAHVTNVPIDFDRQSLAERLFGRKHTTAAVTRTR